MSQLFVDSIEPKTSGEVVSINRGKGQILEVLSSICDGSTVEVTSGSYTFQNVTTQQVTTSSYVDITGSLIVINHLLEPQELSTHFIVMKVKVVQVVVMFYYTINFLLTVLR